jgi:hypothetical protein
MIPDPVPHDLRKETLEKFKKTLERATQRQVGGQMVLLDEEGMRDVNQALRELLNVDYCALEIIPTLSQSIDKAFIAKQYQNWIHKQAARLEDGAGSDLVSNWNLLGLASPVMVEVLLNSLAESVTPKDIEEIAEWLIKDVGAGQNGSRTVRQHDYRPFLAVRMANVLLGDCPPDPDEGKPDSYSVLVEPFLRKRLPELISAPIRTISTIDVPGTTEVRQLCRDYDIPLAPANDPGANP